MSERRERRKFTEEFKKQVVSLFNDGKPRSEIIKEYDLTASAFNRWVKEYNTTNEKTSVMQIANNYLEELANNLGMDPVNFHDLDPDQLQEMIRLYHSNQPKKSVEMVSFLTKDGRILVPKGSTIMIGSNDDRKRFVKKR